MPKNHSTLATAMRVALALGIAAVVVAGGAVAAYALHRDAPNADLLSRIPQTGNKTHDTDPFYAEHLIGEWSGTTPDIYLDSFFVKALCFDKTGEVNASPCGANGTHVQNMTMMHLQLANVSAEGAVVNGVGVNSSGPFDVIMRGSGGDRRIDADGFTRVPIYIGHGYATFVTWKVQDALIPRPT